MFDDKQTTLAGNVVVSGIGLHGGCPSTVTLRPAPADAGIVIERGGCLFKIDPTMVQRTQLCTRLLTPCGAINMIEHLLAALAITGIDNVIVSVAGDEVPVLDGSARPWADAFLATGLRRLSARRNRLKIRKPFKFEIGNSLYMASPTGDSLSVTIDFPNTVIGTQTTKVSWDSLTKLLDARTFVLEKDIAAIREIGLAKGGSYDNAIVVGKTGPLNPGGLRSGDEFVRHKALDLVGDLYVAGRRISGTIRAVRPGHSGNNAFLISMISAGVFAESTPKEAASFQWPWLTRVAGLVSSDVAPSLG